MHVIMLYRIVQLQSVQQRITLNRSTHNHNGARINCEAKYITVYANYCMMHLNNTYAK